MSSWPGKKQGYRIASTEAGLSYGNVPRAYKWPAPEPVEYNGFSERTVRGDSSEGRHGHKSVVWYFREMTRRQAAELRAIVVAGETNGWLYLTTDRNDATSAAPDWVDVRGKPVLPEFKSQGDEMYPDIVLTVRAVEIVNDPATF